MKVVVTGATGFIAQHCIQELLSHRYTVVGTVRNIQRARQSCPILQKLDLVEADLLDDSGWVDAFDGADAVLHTASPVIIDGKEADLIGPAVEGTERVLRAAANAGVKRIVLTSSTAAIVNTDAEVYTEENWSEPERCSPYPKSKTLAERAAWQLIENLPEDTRPELVVCNPCVVLGPPLSAQVSSSVSIIQKLMNRRIPAMPNIGFSIVDVRDIAIAHRLALETPEAAGNRYLLSTEFYWLRDIAAELRKSFADQGIRPTRLKIPNLLIGFAARVHPFARTLADDLGQRSQHDTQKARQQLGWRPRPVKDTIIATGQALIDQKLLD
ncbi:3 beta-hydroxysteroid dehydrogenase/Delta 5--_4-isomerase [BD1-7 clade bacterium]|uniref:3 beta-hydroxysteroid dehydrogenase/Delta 5-->4-isomerase n=1 Tax=BD1-7 clade bacterium TaxID=2029982 RepID=A0A5S9PHF1_9GAMM|nr:3 beta-hydroxysteroid dehydrogenase/Delta 5-->4-isomerase [BD1-7 clade bacterium]CAA0103567.1 3 beta-hydroxysteroid dehydrogenase/Delta 5-->4-isomerase [BD1-7 clade bacterium]